MAGGSLPSLLWSTPWPSDSTGAASPSFPFLSAGTSASAAPPPPFTLRGAVGIFQSIVVGLLVDRFSPARVLFFCAALAGLGFLLLSQVNSYAMFLVVFLCVISLGMVPFDAATTVSTSRWFTKKRGKAMSLSYTGFAFGSAVVVPVLALVISTYGWRTAAFIVAIVVWSVAMPLSTRLYSSPESRGLQPDGPDPGAPPREPGPVPTSALTDFSRRAAFRNPAYWMLSFSCGLRAAVFMSIGLHMVAVMIWKGIDEATAGVLIGVFGFVWLVATPVMGWAGDRWSKTRVAATPAFLGAGSMLILLFMDRVEAWQMAVLLALWASNEGSWALNFSILADRFGLRHYGALRGGMLMVVNITSFGAPFYSGWVFDTTESYYWVIFPAVFLLALAGLLNWFLPQARPAKPVPA